MQTRLQEEPVRRRVVPANRQQLGHLAASIDARDVRHDLNGERDRLTRAPMRQSHVGGQDAMRQPRQGLLGGVRVNRAHAAEMPSVQRLQQIERFRASHLADEDAVGPVAKRGP